MSLSEMFDNHLFFSNLFVSSLLNWGGLPTASKWYGPITYHIQRRWSAPITDHVNSFYVENVYIWFGFELTYCGDNLGCPYPLYSMIPKILSMVTWSALVRIPQWRAGSATPLAGSVAWIWIGRLPGVRQCGLECPYIISAFANQLSRSCALSFIHCTLTQKLRLSSSISRI